MSNRYPWTAFYWEDWCNHTAHLSHAEYSIYHRLLAHYYKTQSPLLANASVLPRLCCAVGTVELEALQSVLSQFFDLRTDGYHNDRADKEIAKALSVSKERQEVGRKGGLAKARNLAEQNATHPQPHTQQQNQKRGSAPRHTSQSDWDERDFRLFCAAKKELDQKLSNGWGQDLTDEQIFEYQANMVGRTPKVMREILDRLGATA